LEYQNTEHYPIVRLESLENYAQEINTAFEKSNAHYLIFLEKNIEALDEDSISELLSWFQIPAVGMVTGKILNTEGKILHAGLVHRLNGLPLSLYVNFPENSNSYMGVTHIVRNVSSPHPACCAIRRDLWEKLGGLNTHYTSPYGLFDFALRALHISQRIVFTPFARFSTNQWHSDYEPTAWRKSDKWRFIARWAKWLKNGDSYYNPNLTLDFCDMGLNVRLSKPRREKRL